MKNVKQLTMFLLLGALVVTATAVPASAAAEMTGKFTLPVQAYWGSTLLPAGEYSFSMDAQETNSIHALRINGQGIRATFLAAAGRPVGFSSHSELQLQEVNGVAVVRRMESGYMGQVYFFGVSKDAHKRAEQGGASSLTSVAISTNAGQ